MCALARLSATLMLTIATLMAVLPLRAVIPHRLFWVPAFALARLLLGMVVHTRLRLACALLLLPFAILVSVMLRRLLWGSVPVLVLLLLIRGVALHRIFRPAALLAGLLMLLATLVTRHASPRVQPMISRPGNPGR